MSRFAWKRPNDRSVAVSRPRLSESARLLRQRAEMGGGELFLDGMTRDEALALAAVARSVAEAAASGTEASPVTAERSQEPESTAAPSQGGAGSGLPDSYEELRQLALGCTRCRLAEGRTQVVFSDGQVDARLMVVGEAPGADEDRTGIPFVGAAGKYLDLLLGMVDLSREESVYICNVLKCRPPGNRNPMSDEIEACSPFLKKQIDLIQPEALLAVGSFAAQLLTGRDKTSLGKLRGEVHAYHGVPLVVTYHPAALLRNPKWTRAFWDDLQLLRGVMDSK